MKSSILVVIMLYLSFNFAQTSDTALNFESDIESSIRLFNLGGEGTVSTRPKEILGNIHVFKNWNNKCVLSIEGKVYKLANINLNILTNKFESQMNKDSVFVFNFPTFDHIFINNRKFKNFYISKEHKNETFELIYDGEDIKILKRYEVGVKHNDPDPLMIRKNADSYFKRINYFVKEGNDFKNIKLKKKDILLLFDDKVDLVSKYVKENKLSYKSDKDLNKMFIYYDSL